MAAPTLSITKLAQTITKLPPAERTLFERIYQLDINEAELYAPPTMYPFVKKHFGSIEAVEHQTTVKIINRVTLETSLFNPLRAFRPMTATLDADLDKTIAAGRGASDPFNNILEDTAEDVFGRVEGEFCLTASNIAKIDAWHGVTIFNEYNPLDFDREQVVDYFMTARTWAEAALANDPRARYFLLAWNCLWKAGASIIHGHLQMSLTHDKHYGKIERLRRDAVGYRSHHNRSYFTDLVNLHRSLNLTADPADRVKAIVSLTPLKEREIWLLTDDFSPELAEAVYATLAFYQSVGVTAFNLAVLMPPLSPPLPNAPKEDWSDFPVIVRLVDRGDPLNRSSDVAAFEFFAASVITGDPFRTAADLKAFLPQSRSR